nr:hypothetical protein [Candidatus Freyrarchaeum guaymaensis]
MLAAALTVTLLYAVRKGDMDALWIFRFLLRHGFSARRTGFPMGGL